MISPDSFIVITNKQTNSGDTNQYLTSCHWTDVIIISAVCVQLLLPPTKEEVKVFAHVCLSVCLLARLLKNACMDLDEMLRVDRCRDMDELINF